MGPRLIRIAAVIAAAIGIYALCVVPYRANMLLAVVDRRSTLAESANPSRAAELAHENLRDLDIARPGVRLDPNWYLLYGANCETLGRWDEAASVYTAALRIDQRPEIYVSRGLVMLQLGKLDAAEADLTRAARFNPNVLNQLGGDLRDRVAAAAGIR